MLGTQHGGGRRRQRGDGRGIDVDFSHIAITCKQGTRFAFVRDVETEVLAATSGAGPLLQRDYWAVFAGCALKPSEVMTHVKTHFCELPPASLVQFVAPAGLNTNAELDVHIVPAQSCRVRVMHEDAQSLTFGTLEGHPEAGRITFGAYRNAAGDVIFHIRSRARSATMSKRVGFLAIGDAMQTNTWSGFINNIAAAVGARIADAIRAETKEVEDRPEDDHPLQSPTFLAVGD
jgi:uncharacterized protein (UPF0548 family)